MSFALVICEFIQSFRILFTHFCIHFDPPARSKYPHKKNNTATRQADKTENCEKPAITYSINDRSCDERSNTREYISHEIIQGNSFRRSFGHKFSQHSGNHTEDQHRTDSKEKVRNHLRLSQLIVRRCHVNGVCKLTGTSQKTPFSAVQPYHISAMGYSIAPSQAFSRIRSSGR